MADIMPEYWSQTEQHKRAAAVNEALFAYQEYLRQLFPDGDEWRKIYGMRGEIGLLEKCQALQAGYKDGRRECSGWPASIAGGAEDSNG